MDMSHLKETKSLDKLSREEFFQRLYAFHEQQGTPVRKQPVVCGKPVDLYELYQYVKENGGYRKITESRKWTNTARVLYSELPYNHTLRAGYMLRNYYLKYLKALDEGTSDLSKTMLLQSTPFNTPLALRTTPINKAVSLPFTNLRSTPQATPSATSFVSKPAQPQAGAVTMTTKPQELLGLCQDGGSSSPGLKLDKIMRSLESGFSNEVDLVMNILLMISDNGDITIEQHPHLLPVMMANVGVLPAKGAMNDLYRKWSQCTNLSFSSFWAEMVPEEVCKRLLPHFAEDCQHSNSLFNSKFKLGSEVNEESYRISQVLTILDNLCTQHELVSYLTSCDQVLTFLVLCASSTSPELSTHAMDIIGNIAYEIELNLQESYEVSVQLINLIKRAILSCDRHMILRGMEILAGLAVTDLNVDFVFDLPEDVFQRILNMLLLSDLQLLLGGLDCLISLSSSEELCPMLMRQHGTINTLLSLMSYDSSSLKSYLLEHLLYYEQKCDSLSPKEQPQLFNPLKAAANPQKTPVTTQGKTVGFLSSTSNTVLPSMSTTTTTTSSSSVNMSGINVTVLAKTWLRACYEEVLGAKSSWSELYLLYSGYCSLIGNGTCQNTAGFLATLRSTFPKANLKKLTLGKESVLIVEGIKKRDPKVTPVLVISEEAAKVAKSQPKVVSQPLAPSVPFILRKPSLSKAQFSLTSPTVSITQVAKADTSTTSVSSSLSHNGAPVAPVNHMRVPHSTAFSTSIASVSSTSAEIPCAVTVKPNVIITQCVGSTSKPLSPAIVSTAKGRPSSPIVYLTVISSSSSVISAHTNAQSTLVASATAPSVSSSTVSNPSSMPNHNDQEMQSALTRDPLNNNNFVPTTIRSQNQSTLNPGSLRRDGITVTQGATQRLTVGRNTTSSGLLISECFTKPAVPPSSDRNSVSIDGEAALPHSVSQGPELFGTSQVTEMQRECDFRKNIATSHLEKIEKMDDRGLQVGDWDAPKKESSKADSNRSLVSQTNPSIAPDFHLNGNAMPEEKASALKQNGTKILLNHEKKSNFNKFDFTTDNMTMSAKSQVQRPEIKNDDESESTDNMEVDIVNVSTQQESMDISMATAENAITPENMKSFLTSPNGKEWLSKNPKKKVCRWEGCYTVHDGLADLECHLRNTHLTEGKVNESLCRWDTCSSTLSRKRLSLLIHVKTCHCIDEPLTKAEDSRINLHGIIKKIREKVPFEDEKEDTLTKAIRLSSAMVLRNLAKNSQEARSAIITHESRLAEMAMNDQASSVVLSECLYYLHPKMD